MALKLKLMDIQEDIFIPLSTKEFKKLPGIYIIKNILNNKNYVGESVDVWHRMHLHRSKDRKQVVSKAIHKYGIENFVVYVEYFPNFTKEDLLLFEQHLIKNMDCISPNGYNICEIGNKCPSRKGITRPPRTKEWCDNLSKSLKGKMNSEETRKKMSQARIGKVLSDETKMKISNKHKGKNLSEDTIRKIKENNPSRRAVLQFDINGNFLAEYISLYEAERATGGIATNISNACKGKYKSCVGFIWKFKNSD